MPVEKDVLTTGEVAKLCNVAPRTVSVLLAELDALDVSVEDPSLETVIDSVFRSEGDDVGD